MAETVSFNIQAYGSQQVVNDLNKLFAALQKATLAQKQLNDQISTLTNRSKANASNRANLAEQITGDPTKTREALKKLREQLKDYEKQLASLGRTAAGINVLPSGGPISRHRQEIERLTLAYTNLSKEARAGTAGKNLLTQIRSEAADLKRALLEVRQAQGLASGSGGRPASSNSGSNFGNTLANVFKFQASSYIINTISEAFLYAEETVRKFDAELTNLSSLLNSSDFKRLNELSSSAQVLGQTTAFTAVEVVQLQQELIKLGFSVQEVLQSQRAIIDFSVAVRESADVVALLTGATLRAFNLSSLETERVVNVLTRGIVNSALSFEYLNTALPTVSAAAETANISLEETVAVLGVLADRGVKASTAATSFRNILIESAKRGLTYQEALDRLANSSNKLATAFDLFGKRGAVQALILVDNLDGVKKKTEELVTGVDAYGNALKSAREIAAIQLTSIQGNITLLKSAWDGFLLAVGNTEAYKKATTGALQFVTGALGGLTSLIDGTVKWKDAVTEIKEAFSPKNFELFDLINPFHGLEIAGDILNDLNKKAADRRLIVETTNKFLQEQARLQVGIFSTEQSVEAIDARKAARLKLINDTVAELQKSELTFSESYKIATTEIYKTIDGINELLKTQKKASEDDLQLLRFTSEDIKAVQSIGSAKQLVEAFQEAVNATDQNTPEFGVFSTKLKIAEQRLKELKGVADAATGSLKSQDTLLESLNKKLSEYEKQLKSSTNENKSLSIIEDIRVTKSKIDDQTKLFTDFINKLNDETIKFSSDNIRKERIDQITKALETEKALLIQQARQRITSEQILAKEIEVINNEIELKKLASILNITKNTDDEFEKLKASLQEKFATTFALKIDLQFSKSREDIELQTSKALLSTKKLITEESERKILSDNIELQKQKDLIDSEIQALEVKQAIFKLTTALGGAAADLTKQEQTKLNTLKLQKEEIDEQLAKSNATLSLGVGVQTDQATNDYLKELKELYRQFDAGEIKPITADIINGVEAESALSIFNDLLEKVKAKYELILAEIEKEKSLAEAATLPDGLDRENAELSALAKFNEKKLSVEEIANKKAEKTRERNNKRLASQTERYYKQMIEIASSFGETFAETLFSEDDIKSKFKKILISLVDLIANYYVGQLGIQLQAKFFELANPVTAAAATASIAALSKSIVGIKIGAAVAKGLISRFEQGGEVVGPPHSRGGVQYRVRGTNFYPELEGEEIIINKRSAKLFRKELSRINSYRGYGRAFGDGGIITSAPQVLAPPTDSNAVVSDETYIKQATIIADKVSSAQVEVLLTQNNQLVKALTDAIKLNTKISERLISAEKAARV